MLRTLPIVALAVALGFLTGTAAEIDLNQPVTLKGKVLDPDGKPSASRVRVFSVKGDVLAETRSNSSGMFEIQAHLARAKENSWNGKWEEGVVAADNDQFCPSWVPLETAVHDRETILRLVKDVPIHGTVLDASGKPIPNARVKLHTLHRFPNESLDGYLKTYRDKVTRLQHALSDKGIYGPLKMIFSETEFTADKQGKFTINGLGKERVIQATIEGPTIAGQIMMLITRPQIEAKWKRTKLSKYDRMVNDGTVGGARIPIVYPAHFHHLATPAAAISGTVKARDTAKPLAGVRVSAQMSTGQGGAGVTDENGKYTITGLPTQGSVNLYVVCPDGMAYVNAERRQNEYTATSPIENPNFELSPGILARGSVTDSAGRPVRARVDYLCLRNNEYANQMADRFGSYGERETDENGDYQIVVIPGEGIITADAREDNYEKATFEGLGLPLNEGVNRGMLATANWGLVRGERYDALEVISPKSLQDDVTIHLELIEGNQIRGKLVDANGKPVRKTKWWQPNRNYGDVLESNEFAIHGLSDDEVRRIVFRHEGRRMGAVIEVDRQSKNPLIVKLRPYATVTGRLVDTSGKPVAKARYVAITAGSTAELKKKWRPEKYAQASPRYLRPRRNGCRR